MNASPVRKSAEDWGSTMSKNRNGCEPDQYESASCRRSGLLSGGFGREDRRNTAVKSGNNILAGQLVVLLEPTYREVESVNANRPILGIDDPDEGHARAEVFAHFVIDFI
jgi:hypothetical protein